VAALPDRDAKSRNESNGKADAVGYTAIAVVTTAKGASGRQKHYRANPLCPIHDELRGIARKTAGLTDILREVLAPLSGRIVVAFVYGSQASGMSRAASDVDLMVVGKAGFGEVVAALQPAQEKLGREINSTVYSEAEFSTRLHEGHHFVKAVVEGPKLFVVGDERELAGLGQERLDR